MGPENKCPCMSNLKAEVKNSKSVCTKDLFMSIGAIFWDVILGWYYDILGWKFIMIFNWEKKTVLDQ